MHANFKKRFPGNMLPPGVLWPALVLAAVWLIPEAGDGRGFRWSTLAGNTGGKGFADGTVGEARFNGTRAVAEDSDGNLLVTESTNHTVRRITTGGDVTTVAGRGGIPGHMDGPGGSARFSGPTGIVVAGDGTAYLADTGNHVIRSIAPDGTVATLAGTAGFAGFADGTGTSASFSGPTAICLVPGGDLLVADTGNHRIRRVTPAGAVATLAVVDGTTFNSPRGVAAAADGTLYVADTLNRVVRKIAPDGTATVLAGLAGSAGSVDGTRDAARFNTPESLLLDDSGRLYVADLNSRTLRVVETATGVVSTLAGKAGLFGTTDGQGASARFTRPGGLALARSGTIVMADSMGVRRVTTDGWVSTIAANPPMRSGAQDGIGQAATMKSPKSLSFGPDGKLYVAEPENFIIRSITPQGEVAAFAGSPGLSGYKDGTGAAARFGDIVGIAWATDGRLRVLESPGSTGSARVRAINLAGQVTTVASTPGTTTQQLGLTSLAAIASLVDGRILIGHGPAVRSLNASGTLTHLVGPMPSAPVSGISFWRVGHRDGAADAAWFHTISGIAPADDGGYFLSENGNHDIRRVSPEGMVSTVAGYSGTSGGTGSYADGPGALARFNTPEALAATGGDTLVVADAGNHLIRRVNGNGEVSTVGGVVGYAGLGEGVGDRAAFNNPSGIVVDAEGNIYVADTANHRIVKGEPLRFPEMVVTRDDSSPVPDTGALMDAGHVPVGVERSVGQLTIANPGNIPLEVSTIRVDGPDAGDWRIAPATGALVIPPEGAATLTVLVTPSKHAVGNARLTLLSDAPDRPVVSLDLRAVGNSPPLSASYEFSTVPGRAVELPLAKLLRAVHDPDGDPPALSVVRVTHGAAVMLGDRLRYTPPDLPVPFMDFIELEARDPFGAPSSVGVTVSVSLGHTLGNPPANPGRVTLLADGTVAVRWQGIPGRSYGIERSADLMTWQDLGTVVADDSGLIHFPDPAPLHPNGYYRLMAR